MRSTFNKKLEQKPLFLKCPYPRGGLLGDKEGVEPETSHTVKRGSHICSYFSLLWRKLHVPNSPAPTTSVNSAVSTETCNKEWCYGNCPGSCLVFAQKLSHFPCRKHCFLLLLLLLLLLQMSGPAPAYLKIHVSLSHESRMSLKPPQLMFKGYGSA